MPSLKNDGIASGKPDTKGVKIIRIYKHCRIWQCNVAIVARDDNAETAIGLCRQPLKE
jgi:hypothetical protein